MRKQDLAAQVASCPECGCLIWVNVFSANGLPGPFDFYRDALPLLARAIGPEAFLRQGPGINDGGLHACPPIEPRRVVSEPDDQPEERTAP